MNDKKLSLTESIMLIAGSGIGIGMFTIPYAVNKVGLLGTIVALIFAYVLSLLMYFYIADLTLHSKDSKEMLGILKEHLFKGKFKKFLTGLFFVLLTIIIVTNLVAYVLSASDVIYSLFGANSIIGKSIFTIISALFLLSGIKGIGRGEKYAVIMMATVIIALMILALSNISGDLILVSPNGSLILALYGLFMFAFSSIFSIIQVANEIENKANISKTIIIGLSLNAILTFLFAVISIIGSKEVTELATIGLTDSLNNAIVKYICGILLLLAMFTSYLSNAYAFIETLSVQTKLNKKICTIITTLLFLCICILIPLSILDYVQLCAGALSLLLGIIIVPSYYIAIKNVNENLLLGKLAKNKIVMGTVILSTIVMAISTFINID